MMEFLSKKWQQWSNPHQMSNKSKFKAINKSNATKTNLMGMNVECLEHILSCLSIEDLLNIVHAYKQLRPVAESVFARNFGREKLAIWKKSGLAIRINETEEVQISNPHRLLLCFGHLISKQKIEKQNGLKYVIQYCRKSTTEITFHGLRYFPHNMKSFPSVEKVYFVDTIVKTRYYHKVNLINKFFPNLRTLSFVSGKIKPEQIEVHFAHLNQLVLSRSNLAFKLDPHLNMIRLNPQIHSLNLLGHMHTATFIRFASQHLEFLEYLHIHPWGKKYGGEIKFANLKHLKITTDNDMNSPYYYPNILITSDFLNEFSFGYTDRYINEISVDIVINFLKNHRFITKLNLTCINKRMQATNTESLIGTVIALPLIEEIDFTVTTISVNVAIQLVENCKSLNKLCFRVDENADFDYVRTSFGEKWQIKIKKCNKTKRSDITIVKRH